MSDRISFEELWDDHVRADLFRRDHDGEHAAELLAYYARLEPPLRAEFRAGLARVIAADGRGAQAARACLAAVQRAAAPDD